MKTNYIVVVRRHLHLQNITDIGDCLMSIVKNKTSKINILATYRYITTIYQLSFITDHPFVDFDIPVILLESQ